MKKIEEHKKDCTCFECQLIEVIFINFNKGGVK